MSQNNKSMYVHVLDETFCIITSIETPMCVFQNKRILINSPYKNLNF